MVNKLPDADRMFPKLTEHEEHWASNIEAHHTDYAKPAKPQVPPQAAAAAKKSAPKKSRAPGERRIYQRATLEIPRWFRIEDYDAQPNELAWALILDHMTRYRGPRGYLFWLTDRLVYGPLYKRFKDVRVVDESARRPEPRAPREGEQLGTSLTLDELLTRTLPGYKRTEHLDPQPIDCHPGTAPDRPYRLEQPILQAPLEAALLGAASDLPLTERTLLLVDRHGYPESVLIDAFTAWLRETRIEGHVPGVRTGPADASVPEFVEYNFSRWHAQRIVAYFELKLWAERHNVRYTKEQLWLTLFIEKNGDWCIPRAREVLEEALRDERAFGNQVRATDSWWPREKIGPDLF
jgi:hypothetical protein